MKRIIFAIIEFVSAVSKWVYVVLTRKSYYITGTFRLKGERMFFRSVFETYGNIMPIRTLEEKYAKAYEADNGKVVILHFSRLPRGMSKYVGESYGQNFLLEKEI